MTQDKIEALRAWVESAEAVKETKGVIEAASVELRPGEYRSVSYYVGVALDYYGHDFERVHQGLMSAAARAVLAVVKEKIG